MSLASRAGDLYFTFRFIKLLTTPWVETDAFKLGIIDDEGKRIKSNKINTSEEKDAYTTFLRLVYNIKRLLNKLPGGSSKIASYAAAFFLLKEQYGMTDKSIEKIVKECGLDISDFIAEQSGWYVLEDKRLSPGIYRVRNEKVTDIADVNPNDKIRILDESYPIGDMFGLDIYKATHINSDQPVYVTLGEIYK